MDYENLSQLKTTELIEALDDTMYFYRTCTITDPDTNEEVTAWEVAQNSDNPIIVRDVNLKNALIEFYIQTQ